MKINKEKSNLWKKINNKFFISWFLVFVLAASVIIILSISLCKSKDNKFENEIQVSVKDHIKDNGVEIEYKEKENILFCKRGPIVFKSISKVVNKHTKGHELLKNLINWFYENVSWGPEVIHLREIIFSDTEYPSDANSIIFESCCFGTKRFGVSTNGIVIYLTHFLKSFEKVKEEYLNNYDGKSEHPLSCVIDKIQYLLHYAYSKMQMSWFFADQSTSYRCGGWHFRAVTECINLRTEQIYKKRFKDSQKCNWRYPFNTGQLKDFDEKAYRQITLEEVYKNANNLESSTKLWSDKKDLYHIDQEKLKNNNIVELTKNKDNYSTYYNGSDRGKNLSSKELSVWETDNLLEEFKDSWLKPFCKDFDINIDVEGIVDRENPNTCEQLIKLIKILKLENCDDNSSVMEQWAKINKHQFRGYSFNWIKDFVSKVVLKVINFNKKIGYDPNQNFTDICKIENTKKESIEKSKKDEIEKAKKEKDEKIKKALIKQAEEKAKEAYKKLHGDKEEIIPTNFTIDDKLIDKNKQYIAHPDYPISLGSEIISYFDYYSNLAGCFAARDFMAVSTVCEANNTDKFVNNIATNINNKFWNDISFLKAFNAFPYEQNNKVDEELLSTLAKVMRIDQDIAMTYKSDNSSLSYMWGYMPQDANYRKLVFKNDSKTKTIPIYQSKQSNSNNNDSNALDFDHMFYNQNFMNKSTRQSLAKFMKRKAWITDWNLLTDYDNAIVPAGEYKVYFEDENGKHIPVKNYDDAGLTDYQFKLNAGSEYDCFSQYVFHYDTTAKTMILNVRKIVA